MRYAEHYDRLIARAKSRALVGYSERHHILPRCMGGGDEQGNIVRLTAEEHYVAHQLLVKMHPRNGRLTHAAVLMAKRATGNKAYAWLRNRNSKAMLGNTRFAGKTHSVASRDRIASALRGVKHSVERRGNQSRAKLGKKQTPQAIAIRSAARRGNVPSQECRTNISAALKGRPFTEAHRGALSAAQKGTKRRRTAEHQARIWASRKANAATKTAP